MRIAYLVPSFPSLLQTYICNEIVEIQKAGHEVMVVPLYAKPSRTHERFREFAPPLLLPSSLIGVRVVWLALRMLVATPVTTLKALVSLHRAAGWRPHAHVGLLVVLPKALATAWRLRGAKVDRVHAHFATYSTACAAIAGAAAGIPYSFTAHAHDIYCTAPRFRNDTLAWKARHAAQVFAVSRHAADRIAEIAPDVIDRIHISRVGIPLDVFRPKDPRPRAPEFRLLCICNFEFKKGVDTLIDACALLRERGLSFHLRLFGDGVQRQRLTERIRRHGLQSAIEMGPLIDQEEVARQMEDCDAFVLPCRRDVNGNMDGIPTVLMEAMASQRCVISCPIAGIPELVNDGETGLLVPSEDPNALAVAITRLAGDDVLRRRLARQARALVEAQHDQKRNAHHLLALMMGSSAVAS